MQRISSTERIQNQQQQQAIDIDNQYDDLYYSTNFKYRRMSAPQFVYQKQYIVMNKRDINDKAERIYLEQQTPKPSTCNQVKQWRQNLQLPRIQSSTVYTHKKIKNDILQMFHMYSESVSPIRVQGRPVYSANVFYNNITRQSSAKKQIDEIAQQKEQEIPTNTKIRQLRTVHKVEITNSKETDQNALLKKIRNELQPQKRKLQLRNGVFQYQ